MIQHLFQKRKAEALHRARISEKNNDKWIGDLHKVHITEKRSHFIQVIIHIYHFDTLSLAVWQDT